jgi:16S rRNA (guanine1207-N2)-methyltransferase
VTRPDRLALAVETGALSLPESGMVVVLRAEPSAFLDAIPAGRLRCEQGFRPIHDTLAAVGLPVEPRLAPQPAAMVVVNATRSRAETLGNVARGLAMLAPGGLLALNGAKSEGVDALARELAAALPVERYVKAHGRVVWATRPGRLPEAAAHWAAAAQPARNAAGFVTAPGMFSPEAVDPGSERLAALLDSRVHGRVADLGAGWGWLAHAALARCSQIAAIELHEAEALALDAARANVADPRASFHWSDAAALGRGAAPFDAVICNPPFHQGRAAEPAIGGAFIAAAARILAPAGTLFLVANRQLPYEAALGENFGQVERVSEDRAFKVLVAARPRRR